MPSSHYHDYIFIVRYYIKISYIDCLKRNSIFSADKGEVYYKAGRRSSYLCASEEAYLYMSSTEEEDSDIYRRRCILDDSLLKEWEKKGYIYLLK